MPITLQQVLRQLDTDEPNYTALAALGPEALPHLATLVRGDDPGLASKAAYLASLIQSDEAVDVLTAAATSAHDTVRVAAAAALRNLSAPQAMRLADHLLDDADAGVRKQAVRAAVGLNLDVLAPKVEAIAARDRVAALRAVARDELKKAATARGDRGKPARRIGRSRKAKRTTRKKR
jgi:hypothetical protein